MTSQCSSCEERGSEAGALSCGHGFCHPCFVQYVDKTVEELNRSLRCCVCGAITLLTYESKRENILLRFGRDVEPRLHDVTGIATRSSGDYVFVDPHKQRVYTFDSRGHARTDFAYTFKYDVMSGITVDKMDRIIFPTLSFDATNPFNKERHVALAYYNTSGHFRGFMYLDKNSSIKGLCTSSKNEVLATDSALNRVWVIGENQRMLRYYQIDQLQGELEHPQPWGICVDRNDRYYVTDSANHCVKCYTSTGQLRFSFGCYGEQTGQFKSPTGVEVDPQGRIMVADSGNHRVQMFSDEGQFLSFIVRFNKGEDVYLAPQDVHCVGKNMAAVLLRGSRDARLSEIRVYPCSGTPDILSC